MQIHENYPLKDHHTFHIDVRAAKFAVFSSEDELAQLLSDNVKSQRLILGGGSNMLLTRDFPGIVLKNEIRGISVVHEDDEHVYVQVGAGENWHHFVMYAIDRGWSGIENLSLIPGNVGASPMQNIGAYGVELSVVFWNLQAYHIADRKLHTMTENDCEFGYRESVFKRRFRDQFVITYVTFKLRKRPIFHTTYGAITQELEKMGVKELSIRAISQAVINIRSSKLPNPDVIGNAGSFFKNPTVPKEKYLQIHSKYPDLVAYENLDRSMKLAAGWLIEHSGPDENTSWKGYRKGDAGCHEKQALVLVNHGNATGKEVHELSERIRKSVQAKYGVALETEVNII